MIQPAWTQAKYNPLRVFTPYGKAISVRGTNRYSGQPVNANGLTREADLLRVNVLDAFPTTPTRNNFGVDRTMGHKPGAPVSKHAKGEALDFMIPKFDGNPADISAADRAHGQAIFDWIVAESSPWPVQYTGGRAHRGPYRVGQVIFDGHIWQAAENKVRPIRGNSDPHRNHVHVEVVPAALAPPKPTPILRRGSTGAAVKVWQGVVGATPDGKFGPITERRTKAWQVVNELHADGVVDGDDWHASGVAP